MPKESLTVNVNEKVSHQAGVHSGDGRFQPEELSAHIQDVGAESEPVHQCGHHRGVLEQFRPPGKREVGGHDVCCSSRCDRKSP